MKNILQRGDGEKLFVLTDLITIKVSAKDTANQYSVIEEVVPPGGGPPPHRHAEVEIFYVIEGVFEFIIEDILSPVRVKAGGVVHVPAHVVHTFRNAGTAAGKLLVTILPGNFEHFFHAIGTLVSNLTQKDMNLPPDLTVIDMASVLATAPDYGLEFIHFK
jgi:quercetin dioxygenase-like cupin family protein